MVKSSTKRAFALLLRTEIAIDQSPEGTSYNDGACSYKSSTLFCSKCLFGPHIYLADTRNTYTLNTRSLLDTMVAIKSLALLALAQLTLARPSPPSPPPAFQVTRLNTFEPTGRPEDHSPYRVGFNVTDPSDAAATFCETRWPYAEYNTGYPHDYLVNCTTPAGTIDPAWAFKFVDYATYYNFTLDVRHTSRKHGRRTTRFAKGLVGFDILQCAHAASGFSVCNQKEGVQFPLQVYDVEH
ncbi:hypothetical protein BU26DRAFT_525966 [Trematosphaeria pertusa]|uniref:Uncharacterized protein n=1 Tax=Trematosphaeria pertusa TaxID=390896 RepID=A0A6A6HRR4_9PLEO|nr:uncharacterized protein BU26DRAFT_525966 [Trematosphaeria pertusa]KAF2240498.1 hypothetical protein BU26DRAFT_525966 [Trematosphaeria pertusa]